MTKATESGAILLRSLKLGALVGLAGGALIGLLESVLTIVTVLAPPVSADAGEIGALVAGLLLLSILTALGAALGMALLGALLALWQTLRRTPMGPSKQAAILSTILTVAYCLFAAVDTLGLRELSQAGQQRIAWGLFLLGVAIVTGGIAWFTFKRLFRA
jgi:hypothetical protein